MKKRYNLIFTFISALILFNSCTPDLVDEFTPIEEKWASIEEFINSTDNTKTVSVQSAEKAFVLETDHAIIYFSKESIKDIDTDVVVSGEINIEYNELTNVSDLFFKNLDTETLFGETLYSRYIINFKMKQNNKELGFDIFNPAEIFIKTSDNVIDHERVLQWMDNTSKDGWDLNTNIDLFTENWDFTVDGKNYKGSGFKMLLRSPGTFTIAEHEHLKHDNQLDYGSFNVKVANQFKNSNTKIFLVRKNDFAMIPLDLMNGEYVHNQVRENEEVILFGMTVVDDKLYFGRKNMIVGDVNNYDLSFSEKTYIEAIQELQRL